MGLDKSIRKSIKLQMKQMPEWSREDVCALIEPYYEYDIESLKKQAINKEVNNLIASIKDSEGNRTTLSDNKGTYINIDITKDLKALFRVRKHLEKLRAGLTKPIKKVKKREQTIKGQITFDDIAAN